MLAGLFVGGAAILAARPEFAAGAWPESEALTAAVLFGAALCLLGLGLAAAQGTGLDSLGSPLVLLPLALAGWSVLSAVFSLFPGTALLGAPQNGLGASWFAAQAAFTAAALEMRSRRPGFDWVVAGTAAAIGIAIVCNLRHLAWLQPLLAGRGWLVETPIFGFNEYLAYPALALGAIGAAWFAKGRRGAGGAVLVLALITLVASRNRTAMAAVAVVVPVVVAAAGFRLRLALPSRTVLGLAFVAVAAAALAPLLVIRFADLSVAAVTLQSRRILAAVLDPSLADPPSALLFGHGWGHYQEYLARNIGDTGISLFNSSWIDLARDEFHSHNALLETFFSAGLPGVFLFLAMLTAVVAVADRKLLAVAFVLCRAFVDSLWFSLPSALVVEALAVAVLAGDHPPRLRPPRFVAAGLCFALALVLGGAAAWQRHQSLGLERVRACLMAPGPGCESLSIPADPRGADLGLAALLGEVRDRGPSLPLSVLLSEGQRRCRQSCALALSIALANRQAAMAFSVPPAADFAPKAWREEEERIIARAPHRPDLLTPYLNWLLTTGDEATLRAVLSQAAQADGDHPVVLWFSGILRLDQGGAESRQGVAMMRGALDKGLERFMPVPDTVKASLMGGAR